MTARVRLRAAQDEAAPPPLGPRRGFFRGVYCIGVKRGQFEFHVRKLYREAGDKHVTPPPGISAQGVVIGIGVLVSFGFKEDRFNSNRVGMNIPSSAPGVLDPEGVDG